MTARARLLLPVVTLLAACGGGAASGPAPDPGPAPGPGPGPGPGPVTDGNDTFATSQAVALGSATAGVISSTTDDDWYQLSTPSPGTVMVMLSGLSADADLDLVDAGQAVLATSANAGTANDLVSHAAAGAGTYHAHVIPVVAGATYTLITGFVPTGVADGNDTFATAQAMPLGSPILGAISSNTDKDWYTLTTPGAGTLRVTLDLLMADADLELYGELSYQRVAGSYIAGTVPDVVSYTANAPVSYHVYVVPGGAITPYRVTATFTP